MRKLDVLELQRALPKLERLSVQRHGGLYGCPSLQHLVRFSDLAFWMAAWSLSGLEFLSFR